MSEEEAINIEYFKHGHLYNLFWNEGVRKIFGVKINDKAEMLGDEKGDDYFSHIKGRVH